MAHPNDAAVPVPYTSRLGQKLEAGQTLNVHGKVLDNAQRFEVNLLHGSAEISENMGSVPLHVSVRFDDKKIVFNTFSGGVWGKEERESLPFRTGHDFDLRIRIMDEHFEIMCDGKKVNEFKYREPYQNIDFFQVKGDCTLSGIHWGGRFYSLPYETGFPAGHLAASERLYVYGIPKGERWNLDFVGRNGDVLFHFNPRLKEKAVVRNAQIGEIWGNEEREGPFPFHKAQGFDLTLINEPFSLQMFVNNERIGTWQHRTANPVGDYVGLRIDGEVEITGIEFGHHHQH